MATPRRKDARAAATTATASTTTTRKTTHKPQHQAVTRMVTDVGERALWTPTLETAVSLLILPRVVSALLNPIADCDETFNYWEPLHFLLYGFGFQTWEYSPVYALRSYLYLMAHYVAAKAATLGLYVGLMGSGAAVSKVLVFYGLRATLGLACAYSEALFYRASIPHFGRRTARYLLWFLLWNAGIFHASTALLPSTFVMYLLMLFLAAWMDRQHYLAIVWGVVAVLCGWPYVGVLFVPFLIDTLQSRGVFKSLAVGTVIGTLVLAAELGVNYYFYRKLVLPAWNIVQYNVLSGETDSTLYGTEPWSFYVMNLVLNFNIAALLAAPALVFVLLLPASTSPAATCTTRRVVFLSPLVLWLVIMFSQTHKEERFLFPVYPLLCLAAAITLSATVFQMPRLFRPGSAVASFLVALLVYGSLGSYSALSLSRVASNVINFSAPLQVYHHLHDHVLPTDATTGLRSLGSFSNNNSTNKKPIVYLCVGKEWYRFPTTFFVPTNATRVQFLKSAFTGQLPKHFEQQRDDATSLIPANMNNRNQEEPSRYVDLSECDYVVDLNLPDQHETKFWERSQQWELVAQQPFLNAAASKSPFRSFYVPFVTPHNVVFTQYAVYKKKPSK